jgi:hypothetical protein
VIFDPENLAAGRETDALVSENVLGQAVCRCKICVDTGPNGSCENCEKPRARFYSTHPEKAIGLLELLATENRGFVYKIERSTDSRGIARFEVLITGGKKSPAKGWGTTLALAICRAAVASVQA